ncbi:MAG: hypothetical protein N2C14_26565 [Planctomycetales bacterium]
MAFRANALVLASLIHWEENMKNHLSWTQGALVALLVLGGSRASQADILDDAVARSKKTGLPILAVGGITT